MRISASGVLISIIVALCIITLIVYYQLTGPGWDLIAHYQNGVSLLNPVLYSCLGSPPCGMMGNQLTFWYGTYFEPFRAPLSQVLFALIYPLSGSLSIIVYIAILFIAYLIAISIVCKRFGINRLIGYALMLSPYFIYVPIIPNSTEMLSLIFVLAGLVLLADRSAWSGLLFGIAAVAKYPMLIFLPMPLLLLRPKSVMASMLLFALPTAAWLGFSQLLFHNPLASYEMVFGNVISNSAHVPISWAALIAVFGYQLLFLVVAIALLLTQRSAMRKVFKRAMKRLHHKKIVRTLLTDDVIYRYAVLAVMLALSIIGFWYIGRNPDQLAQMRFGYFAAASSMILVAVILTNALKAFDKRAPILVAVSTIAVLVVVLVAFYANRSLAIVSGTNNPSFAQAKAVLAELGLSNCRVVSNSWVYMIYRGVNAFPQFFFNNTTKTYPIVDFLNKSSATNASYIEGLSSARPVYTSPNFTILLPMNYKCYT